MTTACIETMSLTRCFGQKTALNDFTLTIDGAGITAIVGSNGAGKSTLFRLLLGVDTATSGTCKVFGEDSRCLSESVRTKVGYVNEEHTLPEWMSAEGVTRLQRSFYPQWNEDVYRRTVSYFDIDPKQKIAGLSRGERAGLSLSLALAQQPQLLILDEPTLGLDVVAKQSFLESLMFIGTENDAAIIYCSHQMEEIERLADRLILMERGSLVHNSTPDDFVARVSGWLLDSSPSKTEIADIPGYLTSKSIEGRTQVIVADADETFQAHLEHEGFTGIHSLPINMETAVNAFLSRNHSKPAELPHV